MKFSEKISQFFSSFKSKMEKSLVSFIDKRDGVSDDQKRELKSVLNTRYFTSALWVSLALFLWSLIGSAIDAFLLVKVSIGLWDGNYWPILNLVIFFFIGMSVKLAIVKYLGKELRPTFGEKLILITPSLGIYAFLASMVCGDLISMWLKDKKKVAFFQKVKYFLIDLAINRMY